MTNIISKLDSKWYPDIEKNWDDRLFRAKILEILTSQLDVLDLGAGAGIVEQMNFRGKARKICGIDPDERVTENQYLDEAKVGLGENIPYPDGSFDVVFADNVLEHLDNPEKVFAEVSRVLKPGGHFLFKTPNTWHYMPLIARLTPHTFHRFINRRRGRSGEDTFPTRYRANSPGAIQKLADGASFKVAGIHLIESRPEYLRGNALTYFIGFCYERLVNSSPLLRRFRIVLIGDLVRK